MVVFNQPNAEPHNGIVPDVGAHDARGTVTVFTERLGANDFFEKVGNGVFSRHARLVPGRRVGKGIEKGVRNPCQEHGVVGCGEAETVPNECVDQYDHVHIIVCTY